MVVFITPMSPTMFIQSPHGLACDGRGIAKDDLQAIETMEKREQGIHELFHNAARIHKAMRGNRLLIPIFRKYREACREILQHKKEEAEQFVILSEHCDECAHDQHQLKHDLKCIQSEMREIHNQIKSLEEMKWTDDDSESECSSDCSDSEDEHTEPQMKKYILSPEDSYNLYKLLHEIVEILDKNDIMYWACGGTFLGAIRCEGIIKWDDDLDLCVLHKNKDKLKTLIEQDGRFLFKDDHCQVDKVFYKSGNYPFVDIFFMVAETEGGETVFRCEKPMARDTWKNEMYLEKELMPLKKAKFGAMEIAIPNQYDRYFSSYFGDDWNERGCISHDHKTNELVNPMIEWKLIGSDYEPALPFYWDGDDDANSLHSSSSSSDSESESDLSDVMEFLRQSRVDE